MSDSIGTHEYFCQAGLEIPLQEVVFICHLITGFPEAFQRFGLRCVPLYMLISRQRKVEG